MTTTSRTVSALGILLLVVGLGWWWLGDGGARTVDAVTDDELHDPGGTKTGTTAGKEDRAELAKNDAATSTDPSPGAEAPNPTGSLTVKVLFGADRQPGRDAGLSLRYHGRNDWPGRLRKRTDEKGHARFEGLRPGKLWIRNDRRNHEYERATIVAGENAEVEVHLVNGVDVSGIVVNAQGFPVPGATLLLTGWASSESEVVGFTDEAGRFEQRQIGSLHNLGARAKGYAPSPMHRCAGRDGAKMAVRIVLPGRGGGLHGVVRGPDGKPIDDLIVRYGDAQAGRVMTLPNGSQGTAPRNARTFTDAKGSFMLTGLAPGSQSLVISDRRFVPYVAKIEVTAGISNEVPVQLEQGVTCRGIVRDADGAPAAKIQVVLAGKKRRRVSRHTSTAADGSYQLQGLAPGTIDLKIRDQKRGEAKVTMQGRTGDVLEWSPKLSLGNVLSGVVRGKNGAPVRRVMVQAMDLNRNNAPPWFAHSSTNEAGEFKLVGCPKDARIRLELKSSEYDSFVREVTIADSPMQIQLRWHGPPTARIIGTVLDPDGNPVSNASVTIWRKEGDGGRVYTTKANGKIEIEKQRGGTYHLLIRSSVYPRHTTERRKIANGETLDYGNVQLVHGGRLRVTLTSATTLPKKGIYMGLYTSADKYVARVDLTKPELVSDPAPVGRYLLRLSGTNVIPVEMPVEIRSEKQTQATVPVRFGAPRVFEFKSPEDASPTLDLTITGPGGFRMERKLKRGSTKLFTLSIGCPPGKLRAVAVNPEGHRAEIDFEVESAGGKSKRLRADLR
jgi:protocatechuate 3,4-dioxygenase beta subunit